MDLVTVLSMMAISFCITFLFVIMYNAIVTGFDEAPRKITHYLLYTIVIILLVILLIILLDQSMPKFISG